MKLAVYRAIMKYYMRFYSFWVLCVHHLSKDIDWPAQLIEVGNPKMSFLISNPIVCGSAAASCGGGGRPSLPRGGGERTLTRSLGFNGCIAMTRDALGSSLW